VYEPTVGIAQKLPIDFRQYIEDLRHVYDLYPVTAANIENGARYPKDSAGRLGAGSGAGNEASPAISSTAGESDLLPTGELLSGSSQSPYFKSIEVVTQTD
jgi:hypothetical protein